MKPALAAALALAAVLAVPAFARADPCDAALPRPGQRFSGTVRYVGDGDSLCVSVRGRRGWIEVRLADFSAPELAEPQGRAAKAALERLALGRRVTCQAGRRSFDRVVARCDLGGAPVGDQLRAAGVAEGGR